MILVDTFVWVDHLRGHDRLLVELLNADQVLMHPLVIGELALGHLPQRRETLNTLRMMQQILVVSHEELLHFIDEHGLFGFGIGYVDAHLLAATKLAAGAKLWTRDKRLRDVAAHLDLAANLQA